MNILRSKFLIVPLALFVGWLGLKVMTVEVQRRQVARDVKNLETKVSEVSSENSRFERLLEYFKSPAYLEREARLRLNYKAPDEEVVFVFPASASASPQIADKEKENLQTYEKWWRYLIGDK